MPNKRGNAYRCSIVRQIRSALLAGAGLIGSALSLTAQTPPAGPDSAVITATVDIAVENQIPLWSYENKVMADFSGINGEEVNIDMYDPLGRLLMNERKNTSAIYSRELRDFQAGYVIIHITSANRRMSRKLWITHSNL